MNPTADRVLPDIMRARVLAEDILHKVNRQDRKGDMGGEFARYACEEVTRRGSSSKDINAGCESEIGTGPAAHSAVQVQDAGGDEDWDTMSDLVRDEGTSEGAVAKGTASSDRASKQDASQDATSKDVASSDNASKPSASDSQHSEIPNKPTHGPQDPLARIAAYRAKIEASATAGRQQPDTMTTEQEKRRQEDKTRKDGAQTQTRDASGQAISHDIAKYTTALREYQAIINRRSAQSAQLPGQQTPRDSPPQTYQQPNGQSPNSLQLKLQIRHFSETKYQERMAQLATQYGGIIPPERMIQAKAAAIAYANKATQVLRENVAWKQQEKIEGSSTGARPFDSLASNNLKAGEVGASDHQGASVAADTSKPSEPPIESLHPPAKEDTPIAREVSEREAESDEKGQVTESKDAEAGSKEVGWIEAFRRFILG